MDYIDTLLIMEDDLDENQEDGDLGEFGESSMTGDDNNDPPEQDSSREPTGDSSNNPRAGGAKRRARVLIPPGYLHPGKRKH
jgi:hypothetical protein